MAPEICDLIFERLTSAGSGAAFAYQPFGLSSAPMLETDWKTLNEFGRLVKECLEK